MATYTNQYDSIFQSVGEKYKIDPKLLKTIAIQESGINPAVKDNYNPNGTKDVGLMQINSKDPEYQKYGYDALRLNPTISVQAAAETLQDKASMLKRIGEPVTTFNLLHAYNGWSPQGEQYATHAMGIYNQLGGVNQLMQIDGAGVGGSSSSSNPGSGGGGNLLSNPMEIFWLVLGAALIIMGIYTLFNPFANLPSLLKGVAKHVK